MRQILKISLLSGGFGKDSCPGTTQEAAVIRARSNSIWERKLCSVDLSTPPILSTMPEEERTITKRSKRKVHIKVINMKLIKVTIKLKKLI